MNNKPPPGLVPVGIKSVTSVGMKPVAMRPPAIAAGSLRQGGLPLAPGTSKPPEQYKEYKLRVPKNLVKRYNVMKINSPRPIKLDQVKEANMVRKTKKQVYVEDDTATVPTHGAGSVYNHERKEEARRKRRGYITKVISPEDLPYAMRLNGKGGKRYTGRKEPILDHSAYFIITQSPDGVFEAVPVQAWYSFMPDINYTTLDSDQVEQEFLKRDKRLSSYQERYGFGNTFNNEEDGRQVRRHADSLMIHDDELGDKDDNDFDDPPSESDDKKPTSNKNKKSKKNIYGGKKKKGKDDDGPQQDSDEEEEADHLESKEVDYMSESSSEDELNEMDDDPDPEKASSKMKAKDELNIFSDSSGSESEDDGKQLNQAGKELKAMLKSEAGERSSEDDDEEDEDIDNEYSKSALLMQGKDGKKKKKGGSNNGSKQGSRSSTPVQNQQQQDSATSDTLSQAAKTLKDTGSKRGHDSITGSPSSSSKKQKFNSSGVASSSIRSNSPLTVTGGSSDRSASPAVRSGTPSGEGQQQQGITESAIRRYLSHKPMTTTDLMRKFKTKKTGLSKEQTLSAIAAILKKIKPDQEKIDGKLHLSIKQPKS